MTPTRQSYDHEFIAGKWKEILSKVDKISVIFVYCGYCWSLRLLLFCHYHQMSNHKIVVKLLILWDLKKNRKIMWHNDMMVIKMDQQQTYRTQLQHKLLHTNIKLRHTIAHWIVFIVKTVLNGDYKDSLLTPYACLVKT